MPRHAQKKAKKTEITLEEHLQSQLEDCQNEDERLAIHTKLATVQKIRSLIAPLNGGRYKTVQGAQKNCVFISEKCALVLGDYEAPSLVETSNTYITNAENLVSVNGKKVLRHTDTRKQHTHLFPLPEYREEIDLLEKPTTTLDLISVPREVTLKYITSSRHTIIEDIKKIDNSPHHIVTGYLFYYDKRNKNFGHSANFYRDEYNHLFFIDAQRDIIAETPLEDHFSDEIFYYPIPLKGKDQPIQRAEPFIKREELSDTEEEKQDEMAHTELMDSTSTTDKRKRDDSYPNRKKRKVVFSSKGKNGKDVFDGSNGKHWKRVHDNEDQYYYPASNYNEARTITRNLKRSGIDPKKIWQNGEVVVVMADTIISLAAKCEVDGFPLPTIVGTKEEWETLTSIKQIAGFAVDGKMGRGLFDGSNGKHWKKVHDNEDQYYYPASNYNEASHIRKNLRQSGIAGKKVWRDGGAVVVMADTIVALANKCGVEDFLLPTIVGTKEEWETLTSMKQTEGFAADGTRGKGLFYGSHGKHWKKVHDKEGQYYYPTSSTNEAKSIVKNLRRSGIDPKKIWQDGGAVLVMADTIVSLASKCEVEDFLLPTIVGTKEEWKTLTNMTKGFAADGKNSKGLFNGSNGKHWKRVHDHEEQYYYPASSCREAARITDNLKRSGIAPKKIWQVGGAVVVMADTIVALANKCGVEDFLLPTIVGTKEEWETLTSMTIGFAADGTRGKGLFIGPHGKHWKRVHDNEGQYYYPASNYSEASHIVKNLRQSGIAEKKVWQDAGAVVVMADTIVALANKCGVEDFLLPTIVGTKEEWKTLTNMTREFAADGARGKGLFNGSNGKHWKRVHDKEGQYYYPANSTTEASGIVINLRRSGINPKKIWQDGRAVAVMTDTIVALASKCGVEDFLLPTEVGTKEEWKTLTSMKKTVGFFASGKMGRGLFDGSNGKHWKRVHDKKKQYYYPASSHKEASHIVTNLRKSGINQEKVWQEGSAVVVMADTIVALAAKCGVEDFALPTIVGTKEELDRLTSMKNQSKKSVKTSNQHPSHSLEEVMDREAPMQATSISSDEVNTPMLIKKQSESFALLQPDLFRNDAASSLPSQQKSNFHLNAPLLSSRLKSLLKRGHLPSSIQSLLKETAAMLDISSSAITEEVFTQHKQKIEKEFALFPDLKQQAMLVSKALSERTASQTKQLSIH